MSRLSLSVAPPALLEWSQLSEVSPLPPAPLCPAGSTAWWESPDGHMTKENSHVIRKTHSDILICNHKDDDARVKQFLLRERWGKRSSCETAVSWPPALPVSPDLPQTCARKRKWRPCRPSPCQPCLQRKRNLMQLAIAAQLSVLYTCITRSPSICCSVTHPSA